MSNANRKFTRSLMIPDNTHLLVKTNFLMGSSAVSGHTMRCLADERTARLSLLR